MGPGCESAPQRVPFALMIQSWCELTFLHWRFPQSAIAARVPAPLRVDTWDGWAWVGVTPFLLRGLRPPLGPPLPWISSFPETNCRTYVTGPDRQPGIWFFSLDAARALAVAGARASYGLPYAWSRMRVERAGKRMLYESRRRWPSGAASTRIEVEVGESVACGPLENFLTARFRLYTWLAGRLCYAQVEHAPWPLQEARVIRAEQTLTHCAGLPGPEGPPLAHFSPGVTVRVGPLRAFTGRRLAP